MRIAGSGDFKGIRLTSQMSIRYKFAGAGVLLAIVAIIAGSAQAGSGFGEPSSEDDIADNAVGEISATSESSDPGEVQPDQEMSGGEALMTEVEAREDAGTSSGSAQIYQARLVVHDGHLIIDGLPPLPSIEPVTGPWESYERAIDAAAPLSSVEPYFVQVEHYERAADGLGPLPQAQVYIPAEEAGKSSRG